MKYSTIITYAKTFFTKKRIIWTVVIAIILFAVWFFFIRKSGVSNIQTAIVKRQDVEKTVLTTGQVVSATDLSLSFQTSGFVRRINVKEGDVVKTGQVLAVLDQGVSSATLESAKGTLAQAEANYEKIRSAATAQDVAVSQTAVGSAEISLENAKQDLIHELSNAYSDANTAVLSYTNILFLNSQSGSPQFSVSGTVQTNSQAVINANSDRLAINTLLPSWQNEIANINTNDLDKVINDSLKNLYTVSNYLNNIVNLLTTYTQISSGGSQTTLTTYATGVATAKATVDGLITSIISYRQAVKSAGAALSQAQASLSFKQSPARPEDINIALAQVLSAEGQVHSAESTLNNTVITAPANGTITLVDIKLGELATAGKEVFKLLDVGSLHTEADVSEADIASVVVGQTIDNTFDALGPDKHFQSKVLVINPASTVVSGVVNYKVTGSLENIKDIKPGMTANMTILVNKKTDILVAPSGAIMNKDGKRFVRVIDDIKKKTYHEVEIKTDLEGDGGLVEIVSGLREGQEIVTYIK
ncbi:MAG: efflux RND transporter periplasmic adaptor subunit [Minisyncoccia bacterium]